MAASGTLERLVAGMFRGRSGSMSTAPRALATPPRVGVRFVSLCLVHFIFCCHLPRRHRWYHAEARKQEGGVLPPWFCDWDNESSSSTNNCNRGLAFAASSGGGFGRKKPKADAPKTTTQNQPPNDKKGKGKGPLGRTFDLLDDPSPRGSRAPREWKPSAAGSSAPLHSQPSPADDPPPVKTLDKWGLPIPTVDTLFPPLPVGTELLPAVAPSPHTSFVSELRHALHRHLPLALHRFATNPSDDDASSSTSRASHSVLREAHPPPGRSPLELRLLHISPPVLEVANFLTEAECDDLRSMAVQHEEGSAGGGDRVDPVRVESRTFPGAVSKRTSTSWFCRYSDVPQWLARAVQIVDVSLENIEEPQLVRYRSGQEFTWHYDEVPTPQLGNGGQRLATLLVYLNTLPEGCGGGTIFRDLTGPDGRRPLVVRPQKGSALLFYPAFADGTPDDRTLHRGEAVIVNPSDSPDATPTEKWIAQLWIHQRPYRAAVPPHNDPTEALPAVQDAARRLGYEYGRAPTD